MKTISAGSYSRLAVFDECPKRAELAYLHRIKEPERPPLPAGKEYPNDRGSRIHDLAENYVRGHEEAFPGELGHFKPEFTYLREQFAETPDNFVMEDMWYFDKDWQTLPSDIEPWDKRIWLRIKLDLLAFDPEDETAAVCVDYKTGKVYGNEIKHGQQTQLYTLATFLRYPELETVTAELWYLDHNELSQRAFTRSQGLRFQRYWDNKMQALTTTTVFEPKPNAYSCRFCPFKTGEIGRSGVQGTGDCDLNP